MRSLRIALLFLSAASLDGQSAGDPAASRLWSAHIQPLFAENCFKCHGNIETKSGLSLMSPADLLKGGDNGPAVVPGRPDKSLVYQYVQAGADPHMPPKGRSLAAEEIAILRRWIEKLSPAEALAVTNEVGQSENAGGRSSLFRKATWQSPRGSSAAQIIDHLIE
jgi:mono/diheme cytochrome c family protein